MHTGGQRKKAEERVGGGDGGVGSGGSGGDEGNE